MKPHSFTNDLLLVTSILFTTNCAAPTPLLTASQTPAPIQTSTPIDTAPPAATLAPTEPPLPVGTMIAVEAKEIAESASDFMLLDKDGVGTISINGAEWVTYHSKDTIFKVDDKIIIAGWEYKMVGGKLEYLGPREVLAPRWTKGADGKFVKPVDPETVLPHFNKEDIELIIKFRDQTANLDIFEDGTLPVSLEGLRPDHYAANPVKDYGGASSEYANSYLYFRPIPSGNDRMRFSNIKTEAYPRWIQTDKPAISINGIGVSFSTAMLDRSRNTFMTNSIIPFDKYLILVDYFDMSGKLGSLLFNSEPSSDIENFLFMNNSELTEYLKNSGYKTSSFEGKGQTILSSTFFLLFENG